MTSDNEIYFGNKNTFAIRYIPGYTDKSKKSFFAYCHLVLGGQIIGDEDEICYLNSWTYSLEFLKKKIEDDSYSICHLELNNKSNSELSELIWKENQLEDEFKSDCLHLPNCCNISLDETTDAFLIAMIEIDGKLKFIWKGWREPCPLDKIDKLYSIIVDRELVIDTMDKCLLTIAEGRLSYPIEK
jgi:hypothetical protein